MRTFKPMVYTYTEAYAKIFKFFYFVSQQQQRIEVQLMTEQSEKGKRWGRLVHLVEYSCKCTIQETIQIL